MLKISFFILSSYSSFRWFFHCRNRLSLGFLTTTMTTKLVETDEVAVGFVGKEVDFVGREDEEVVDVAGMTGYTFLCNNSRNKLTFADDISVSVGNTLLIIS